MKRTLLSLGVVAMLATSAFGDGAVWMSAVPVSPNAGIDPLVTPGPGVALSLICDKSVGPCVWDITVTYSTLDGGQGGWSLDLWGDPSQPGKVNLTNVAVFIGPGAPSGGTTLGQPGATFGGSFPDPNVLWGDAGGFTGAPPAGAGSYTLMTFTMIKNPGSNIGDYFIYPGIGLGVFGGNDTPGGGENVALGENPMVDGSGPTLGMALPIARIRNIPEPATMSLLALGGLALIRRRK